MSNNLLYQDNTGKHVSELGDLSADRYIGGVFSYYSLCIIIGMIAAVLVIFIKARMKKIPFKEFELGFLFILPCALIGASFFGKLDFVNPLPAKEFYRMFIFWEPGLSIFGGMIVGTIIAFFWFRKQSQKTSISTWVYADCILPGILLAQAIGRWGNLFNHEILGNITSWKSLSWLPDFIRAKLFYVIDPTGKIPQDQMIVQYREPLFLYESIASLIGWFLLTFIIPNLGRFFAKQPWKVDPALKNPFSKNRWIKEQDLVEPKFQYPLKYQVKMIDNTKYVALSWWQVWNWAYFLTAPDVDLVNSADLEIQNKINWYRKAKERIKKIKINYKNKRQASKTFSKAQKKELVVQKNKEIKSVNKPTMLNYLWSFDCQKLNKLNNPQNYFVIHAGVVSSCYIIIYMFVRIILESFRNKAEYFIQNLPVLNFAVLGLIIVFGIVLLIFAQFIAFKKWRRKGWLYEKSY